MAAAVSSAAEISCPGKIVAVRSSFRLGSIIPASCDCADASQLETVGNVVRTDSADLSPRPSPTRQAREFRIAVESLC